jgi:excisionase family DNA binding protein
MNKLNFLQSFQNLISDSKEQKSLILKILIILERQQINPEKYLLQEEWISVKEACKIIGCSEVSLWKLRRDGAINYSRLKRTIRFKKADVFNYLNQKK